MPFGQNTYICSVKRIAILSLLTLFLFNIIGYYFVFLVVDSENRNEIQGALIHDTSLQTIRISKSELKNVILKDGGKEIEVNGEMYDVLSVSTDGDFLVFKCVNDKNERNLFSVLDKQVKNNSDSNSPEKKQNDSTKNPVKELFCFEKNNFVSNFLFVEFPAINGKLQTVNLSLLSPPPKTA